MKGEGIAENEIIRKLKNTHLPDKVQKWPKEITRLDMSLSPDFLDLVDNYRKLRNELTHPKANDHSIYRSLDNINIKSLVTLTSEFIVSVTCMCDEAFPYWLLGWNFIGFSMNPSWPCLAHNQQFIFAMNFLGFNVPVYDADRMDLWEKKFMGSLEEFKKLKSVLDGTDRCQPKSNRFPHAPRLCKRWWDYEHTSTCGSIM